MSGFCGIINFDGTPVDPQILEKMAESTSYQKPDQTQYYVDDKVGFAHIMLHTTPESLHEQQPLANRSGDIILIANARVDNRDELISFLLAKELLHDSRPTDAEIILAAYEYWGEACANHIIGDFAIVVWDARQQSLFCFMSTVAVLPLLYAWNGKNFVFGTEGKMIIQHPGFPARINEPCFMAILREEPPFYKGQTILQNIYKAPASHWLKIHASGIEIERYWDVNPKYQIRYQKEQEYADHFLDLFQKAISARMRTNTGIVGILVSGGLDSSSIAATAQTMRSTFPGLPALAAIAFTSDSVPEADERSYSQTLTDELGLHIDYVRLEDVPLFARLDDELPEFENPFSGLLSLNHRALSLLRSAGARVVMTGDGGDEITTGSSSVYQDRLRNSDLGVFIELYRHAQRFHVPYYKPLWRYILHPFLQPYIPELLKANYRTWRSRLSPPYRPPEHSWLAPEVLAYPASKKENWDKYKGSFNSRARDELYIKILQISSFSKYLSCLRHDLEYRFPFIDRRLAEFSLAIPPELFYQEGQKRMLLRQSMKGILPERIRLRQDKAFGSASDYFRLKQSESFVRELLANPLLAKYGYVLHQPLRQALDKYFAPPQKTGYWNASDDWPYPLIRLELWLQVYQSIIKK